MTTILILLWLITSRLDVGAKCIVAAWVIASAYFFLWIDEAEHVKRLEKARRPSGIPRDWTTTL